MPQRRQLAAIMFTDMVGYTALMSRDELLAARLRRRHGDVLRKYHELHFGEIVQYFGDGTLSIFGSSVKAIQCAIEIQLALKEDPKVPLRIGIHSGELVWDNEGIYGSSVNIASRLESFAVSGAILTSKKVRNELSNQPDFQFQSLGIFELKNVPDPMEVFAIANEGLVIPAPKELEGKGKLISPSNTKKDFQKTSSLSPVHPPVVSQSGIVVNDILIDSICEDLALYSKDLDTELNKLELDIPSIKREIIDVFPTPIGEQLRILFTRSYISGSPDAMEYFSIPRLKQLANTHQVTLQFICFILMSQIWDEKHKNEDLKIPEEKLKVFTEFFSTNSKDFHQFDFGSLINALCEIFDGFQIPYFIEEFKGFKIHPEGDEQLHQAHHFFRSLRLDQSDNNNPEQIEEHCLEAERHLGTLLRKVAFLVKYELVTIKNIEIIKSRHELARFRHKQITLNRALTAANTGVAEIGVELNNFSDNKSVIFLKIDQKEINAYLNLSPFIIDENALNSEHSSKVFLFIYCDGENYYYQFLNNPTDKPLEISKNKHSRIKSQFDRFRREIFDHKNSTGKNDGKSKGGSRFIRKR